MSIGGTARTLGARYRDHTVGKHPNTCSRQATGSPSTEPRVCVRTIPLNTGHKRPYTSTAMALSSNHDQGYKIPSNILGLVSHDQPCHVTTVTSSVSEQDPWEVVETSDDVSPLLTPRD